MKLVVALFALCLAVAVAQAQEADTSSVGGGGSALPPRLEQQYLFLHPEIDYGSSVMRTPLDVWLNRGFSVLVHDDMETRLDKIDWGKGWISVRDAFTHPREAVERRGGMKLWLKAEYIPTNWHVWSWAFAPNYTGHIIAGGITYRAMAEWYQTRRVPHPRLIAAVSNMAIIATNEMIENQTGVATAGTIADLGINDPLGILLFSFDWPARVAAQTFQAADWSPMASITFPGARLQNSSQMMSYKIPLPLTNRVRMAVLIGQGGAVGGAIKLDREYSVSAVSGFQAEKRFIDPVTGEESIRATYGGGLYLDRNNSLLVSAVYSQKAHEDLMVNVYPGVLPGKMRDLGVWTGHSKRGGWSMGVALRQTLGVGAGLQFAY